MSRVPDATSLLAMRDAMADLQRAARAKDAKNGRRVIRVCWEAAKAHFAADPVSRASFKMRLQGLVDALKAEDFEAVLQVASHVHGQLESLALAVSAGPALASVRAEMTDFDLYAMQLCQETFQDRGTPVQTLMVGMLELFETALVGELEEGETPADLLVGKAEQSEESAEQVAQCASLVNRLLAPKRWAELESESRQDQTPRVVTLVTWLVNGFESVHHRPPGPITRGHYAVIANLTFAAGLTIREFHPELAEELVQERAVDLKRRLGG